MARRADTKDEATRAAGLLAAGRADEAITIYRAMLARSPKDAVSHFNLACALQADSKLQDAAAHYEAALQLKPDFAPAANNLGNLLRGAGQLEAAAAYFARALAANPDHANALASLGGIRVDQDRAGEALPLLERCARQHPKDLAARVHLARAYAALKQPAAAAAQFRVAVQLAPRRAELLNNLGSQFIDAGQPADAVAAFAQAISLDPAFALAHSNLVLAQHYLPEATATGLLSEARRWDARHGAVRAELLAPPGNAPDPDRRLRIGYVSADFRRHPVGFFMAGPLAHHDAHAFDIFCYATGPADAYSATLRHDAHVWRDIRTFGDVDAARLIRGDGIDILVDLAGHTAGNRLAMFAMRVAPIQITGGGHTGTTGCTQIDYLISDRFETPMGADAAFSETLIRMPDGYVCYTPPQYAPPVGPLPAEDRGFVTFGCFNNIAKLNADVAALWARVLDAVPDARLVLRAPALAEPATAESLRAMFAAAGPHAARVFLQGGGKHEVFLGFYNEIDIALDPFPYSGGLTTLEALWMGVPVVTLAGATFAGRHTVSHLSNLGLTDLIASNPADYVRIAAALAADRTGLARLHADLRARMTGSVLLDGARYTRALEAAYRDMWRAWCREH